MTQTDSRQVRPYYNINVGGYRAISEVKSLILNVLITKLNAKRFLKHILKKANDDSALRYAIIKLKSIRCNTNF